jgi:carbon monoxide dehydrogenase subunit G
MMPQPSLLRLIVLGATWVCLGAVANAADDNDAQVRVQTRGDLLIVDASLSVAASPEEAWAVLTDFDHMANFISNLQVSRVVAATGNTIQVEQKGKSSHGPFSIAFESIKEYELNPFDSIRSRLISGTFKRFEGTMQLIVQGKATRLVYHGESIPEMWVPPLIGPALVRSEIQEQFGELRDEIVRRNRISSGVAAPSPPAQ